MLLVVIGIIMAQLPLSQRGRDTKRAAASRPQPNGAAPDTIYDERSDKTIFVIGAGTLRYKDIVNVIDAAKGAGVDKIGIVTEGMRMRAAKAGSE